MSRVSTSYYGADLTTQFAWATTDADVFDRELDLYRLAQAVEHHDHSNTRGLAVARIATAALTEPMYGSLSVSTRALADLSVTTGKLAAGAVTDDKLSVAKMPLAGGVMTGNLQVIPTATPTIGYYYFGNGGSYIGYDGTSIVAYNAAGGRFYVLEDLWVSRIATPTTGYVFVGNAGHYLGFDGTNFVADGQLLRTSVNTADAPYGGMVAFQFLADIVGAGARWQQETTANGRLLVGVGQAGGIAEVFAANTFYGTTWAPLTYMGYSVNTGTLVNTPVTTAATGSGPFTAAAAASNNAAGATNVDVAGHTHPTGGGALTGVLTQVNAGVSFLPPMWSVYWGRRIS